MKKLTNIALTLGLALSLNVGCSDDAPPVDDPDAPVVDDGYDFRDDDPTAYTRVDRAGMPAVATAVIASKDDYNNANPTDDANMDFVGEIVTAIDGLHAALDDDLAGIPLTPCTGGAGGTCVAQGAPLIVPDVLKIDPAMAAGFPNGRMLADPVMDVTLAVVLLDLGMHPVTTLADLPLNPPANDVAFGGAFPYLAPAH